MSNDLTSLPDKQEPILPKAQDQETAAAPAAPAQTEIAQPENPVPENVLHPRLHRTVGNKIYDWGIYTTFAWAGVAAVSLLSAHEAMHGRNPNFNWLRSLNNNVQKGVENLLTKSLLKNAPKETIEGWAKGTTMFVTLGLGGTTMMLPIKWLEDNRQKNACRIDNMLGTTPPHPELVAREVPQTWTSVLSGRMFAWGASYAAFLVMGPKLTDKISKGFGKKFTDLWMAAKPNANPAVVRKWADIGAFDATFTVITATLTYLTSRFVANKTHHPMDTEATLMTIDPSTPTPLNPVYNDEPAQTTEPQQSFAEKHKRVASCAAPNHKHSHAGKLQQAQDTSPHYPSIV